MQPGNEINAVSFRETLGHFASGVTVITTMYENIVHGMTANAFCSVSLDPPLVLVSIDKRAHMQTLLAESGYYGVSVLARNQEALSRHFSGRSQVKLRVPFFWHSSCPLIEGSVAQLVCRIIAAYPVGDHKLYIGQVEALGSSNGNAPLLFYGGKYHTLDVPAQNHGYLFPYEPSWW
jgi:flavin reductase (DIM6/NTAB) family NADH-FMN oxidoreductase RutF